jgi:GNAT superfamily N-acetyltransferase
MWWRKPRAEYERDKGTVNRASMLAIVNSGVVPGLIGYVDGKPAGWCSVSPREQFVRLNNSRTLKSPDAQPVYSVACLFVKRPHRRQGLSSLLLKAACDWVASRGGRIIEGYPIVPRKDTVPDMTAWTGFPRAFEEAGFVKVARPTEARAIYRRTL